MSGHSWFSGAIQAGYPCHNDSVAEKENKKLDLFCILSVLAVICLSLQLDCKIGDKVNGPWRDISTSKRNEK